MSENLDLSLPAKAPSMARAHDESMTLHPVTFYTLADLTDAELGDFERECEAGCFIAAVEKYWHTKGILLVTLDDDELDCNVDSFPIKATDAGLSVVNLQIGNSSWDEEKDGYELRPNGESDDDDDDDGDEGSDDGPPAPTKNVPLSYYIPIYIYPNLSEDKVIADLESAFKMKPPEDFACRVQAKLTPASSASDTASSQSLIQQAAALHPLRCAKNKYLHKTYILVIDKAEPIENGMLMVKLPSWDANSRAGTMEKKQDLRRVGEELALATTSRRQHIRISYSCHDGLQTRSLTLANGDADWPSEDVRAQPVFAVFQYNAHGKELGFAASSIDPSAAKGKPGEERLVYAPEVVKIPGQGLERSRGITTRL